MAIVQQGTINTTALVVPDLYVQIVPPQNLVINGVPTNIIGVVGTASWGPVNEPVIIGSMADYIRVFGPPVNRKHDMGTVIATAIQQGAGNFRCVRVADGNEVKAAFMVPDTTFTMTALFAGTRGSTLRCTLSTGSAAGSWRFTIGLPGQTPEVYDNITGSGNAFWVNLANAVNNGQSALRPASRLVTAVAGNSTAAAAAFSYDFSSGTAGTDGVGSLTQATLIGLDTVPRRGMYALRGQRCSIGVLADVDASAQWSAQVTFGLAEGIYMILTGPSADTISNAVSTKNSAGIDSYAAKLMHGDWVYWQDQWNNVMRLVSPQGFVAGRLANLSPEQSSLNKPLYGVLGTQKSGAPGVGQFSTYSSAELDTLFRAGIDVIANPQPGGNFWGVRCGHNSSSNAAVTGDNYTRLTNYIATSLDAGMGIYVGAVVNDDLFRRVRSTLMAFLSNMTQQGLLGTIGGSLPFTVVCDTTNNPPERVGLGYVQADVAVRYQAINEKFIVNLEGGQTVIVARQTGPAGQIA